VVEQTGKFIVLDALSKGIGRGDAWDALTDAALSLCGKPLFAKA